MKQSRDYLQAKVNTANPAQLHLMLLDGALRYGREAEKGVLRGEEHAYQPPLMRTMDIVEELLASVRHSDDQVNEKLAQLYTFVYARLTSVYVNGDKSLMDEALRVLDYQRETWRQAVEHAMAEENAPAADGDQPAAEKPPAAKSAAPKPHLGAAPGGVGTPGGLSLEA